MFEMSELVNNVVLPTVETDAIIGLNNINKVKHWFYVPEYVDTQIAMLHMDGYIPTMILTDGCLFVGTKNHNGVTDEVKRIEQMLKANRSLEEAT